MNKVVVVVHENGERLPMLTCENGFPLVEPNVYALTHRGKAWRTIKKKLDAIGLFHQWVESQKIDLENRLYDRVFTEAEVNGSLVSYLRRSYGGRKVKKLAVSAKVFNTRLMYVKAYLSWRFSDVLVRMSTDDSRFEGLQSKQKKVLNWLYESYVTTTTSESVQEKGLSISQKTALLEVTDPDSSINPWKSETIRQRNYIVVLLLLNFGLRPGELLTLRVDDIEIGPRNALHIVRRPHDREDPRALSPEVKRLGRILTIDSTELVRAIDRYIVEWRSLLDDKHETGTDFLLLSSDGNPLSYHALYDIFKKLRTEIPRLPSTLNSKSLRHTFSSDLEYEMRLSGLEEERRRQILMYMRGDSHEKSQEVYTWAAIRDEAQERLKAHQRKLFDIKDAFGDVPF